MFLLHFPVKLICPTKWHTTLGYEALLLSFKK